MTLDVDHLARLAGIDLDPGERERLAHHLEDLQRLIDELPDEGAEDGERTVVDVAPRADVPSAPLDLRVVVEMMPGHAGPWLDLPKVREGGG